MEITGSGIRLKARLVQIKTPYHPQKRRPARLRNTSDLTSVISLVFGAQRSAVVCRELTKTYEEVRRATLGELASWAEGDVRGELTLVVAGAPDVADVPDAEQLVRRVAEREATGATRKDAIGAVAREAGLPRRSVYDAVVAEKATRPRSQGHV